MSFYNESQKRFFCFSFIIYVSFPVSCSQQQTGNVEKGRYLSKTAPDEDGVMKILVYYDMGGIAGQNNIRSL